LFPVSEIYGEGHAAALPAGSVERRHNSIQDRSAVNLLGITSVGE
jgi:hypothetical protein